MYAPDAAEGTLEEDMYSTLEEDILLRMEDIHDDHQNDQSYHQQTNQTQLVTEKKEQILNYQSGDHELGNQIIHATVNKAINKRKTKGSSIGAIKSPAIRGVWESTGPHGSIACNLTLRFCFSDQLLSKRRKKTQTNINGSFWG